MEGRCRSEEEVLVLTLSSLSQDRSPGGRVWRWTRTRRLWPLGTSSWAASAARGGRRSTPLPLLIGTT